MKQRTIWISILVLAVIVSGSLIVFTNIKSTYSIAPKPEPDGYMTNVIATNMSQTGKIQSRLYSPEMVHFPLNNSTDITNPHIIFYAKHGSPWKIFAENGKANFGISQIILWNKVHISRKISAVNSPLQLNTQELTVYPHLQFATTDRSVLIKQLDSIVHSKGLRANLKTGVIKLVNQAKGIYDPNSPNP